MTYRKIDFSILMKQELFDWYRSPSIPIAVMFIALHHCNNSHLPYPSTSIGCFAHDRNLQRHGSASSACNSNSINTTPTNDLQTDYHSIKYLQTNSILHYGDSSSNKS